MVTRLVLVPEEEGATYGRVKPVQIEGGTIIYGLSIGTYSVSKYDNRIYLDLKEDIDTIIHETATRKSVNAELRAAEKDARGVEIKPTIILDTKTKRFKQVYP